MPRFYPSLLIQFSIMCLVANSWGCGADDAADYDEPGGPLAAAARVIPGEWTFENSTLWNQESGVLELVKPGPLPEGIRRPGAVAFLEGTQDLADFHFTADLKSTANTEVVGRDVIVVFGYRSPSEFYYAHLSNDNTVSPHNGIFIVNHADRLRIDDQGINNPPAARMTDTKWHRVRVDRNTNTGQIAVFLDDLRTPLMTATDTTFDSGAIGFGSFDDTGAIRRIQITNDAGTVAGPLVDPIPGKIEKGGLILGLEPFVIIPASDTTGGPKARINYLGHAGDNSGRLFVNDLRGKMYLIDGGEVTEYLDLRSQTPDFVDAPGLGSGFGFFAFHPDFARNGKLYTIHTEAGAALENKTPDYSNAEGDVIQGVLMEWTTTRPEESIFSGSAREVLRLGFQSHLHGMQQMAFDPGARPGDEEYGLLYIGVGDGESPGAHTDNAQSIGAHSGKILRIDPLGQDSPNGKYGIPASNPFVGEAGALGEIWALGLRNPHRFSWDALTRDMYIGHIGEGQIESIFLGRKGANYGWNLREGGFRYEKADPREVYPVSLGEKDQRFDEPIARLDHDEISALVGGFVYRGDRLPALYGKYLFGDIVLGRLYYTFAENLEQQGTDAEISRVILQDSEGVARTFEHFAQRGRADLRFGMDANGEIYVLSKANGSIWTIKSASEIELDHVNGKLITFTGKTGSPNGAWCWFQDERVIVDASHPDEPVLMFTSISASIADSTEQGDLDFHWYGIESGRGGTVELYDRLGQDDHNVAALYQLDNGQVMALYSRHERDNKTYVARSGAHNPAVWEEVEVFEGTANTTYNNLLTAGVGADKKLLNFSRSRGWNPNFLVLDTPGGGWKYGGRLLNSEGRPYLKYQASNDGTQIHIVATEQHPRDYDNSIYHGVMDGKALYDSFGYVIDSDLSDQEAAAPTDLTIVFKGDPDNVAWMADVALDEENQPVIAFSVQKDGRDKPPQSGGLDHRYHLARFSTGGWQQYEIAYAGERLYSFEDDYTGLVAIDPEDVNHLVISTNADPVTGAALVSLADNLRHYELFEGTSSDGGKTFSWQALTRDSTVDNIRPIIPAWENDQRLVLWMRGRYTSYTDFDTQIVGIIQNR